MSETIFNLLISTSPLDRDKGVRQYVDLIKSYTDNSAGTRETIDEVETKLHNLVAQTGCKWEERQGYLLGLMSLIEYKQKSNNKNFCSDVQKTCLNYLEDEEVRVRIAAGVLLGELCKQYGVPVYRNMCTSLKILIRKYIEIGCTEDEIESKVEKGWGDRKEGTQGGLNILETCLKCLQNMAKGCGKEFETEFDEELLDLLSAALNHSNRFVRETGYYVCSTLISSCAGDCIAGAAEGVEVEKMEATDQQESPIQIFGNRLSEQLATGLSDRWSEVRLAASAAGRAFLLHFRFEDRKEFFSVLLPRLCLNRYHPTEGVRIHSQKTWSEVVGDQGRNLVQEFLPQTVEHYSLSATQSIPAVREAACQCIAELAKKINSEAVGPFVPQLLRSVIGCLEDGNWPVRDVACGAAGGLVSSFPDESRNRLGDLMKLLWKNLEDPVSSVRQGAASAIASTVRSYGEDLLPVIVEKIENGLHNLSNQPAETENSAHQAQGAVIEKDIHRGGLHCGCNESTYRKSAEPWELADGCVHLVGELAAIKECESTVDSLLKLVSRIKEHKHYVNHLSIFLTVCIRLSSISRLINKRILKSHLEQFFDLIFYSLESENGLVSYSAEQCLTNLSSVLGPNILRGRIEQYNSRYLEVYIKYIQSPVTNTLSPGSSSAPSWEGYNSTFSCTARNSRSCFSESTVNSSCSESSFPGSKSTPISWQSTARSPVGPSTASSLVGPSTASSPVGPSTASSPVGPSTASSPVGPSTASNPITVPPRQGSSYVPALGGTPT